MTPNNNVTSMPNTDLEPAPTPGEAAPTKQYIPLGVMFTVSNPSDQEPTIIFAVVSSNTPTPDATTTPVDHTETSKTIFSEIAEALPFLIEPICYEPKTVLLQLEYINQELIDADTTYKAAVPYPNKTLLLDIHFPLKILTGHLYDHHT